MVKPMIMLFFLAISPICTGQNFRHKVEVTENPVQNFADQINVESIYRALAVPQCIRKCTNGLLQELKILLQFEDVYETLHYLCSEYESATSCMESRHCPNIKIYDIATSGLKSLCIGRKQQFMQNNEQCLRDSLDSSAQACDQKCSLVQSIADFSHNVENSAGYVQLLEHTSPFCSGHSVGPIKLVIMEGDTMQRVDCNKKGFSSGQCFWPCFRDKMNAKCPKSGGILMEVILKPFYYLAEYVETGGSMVQKFIQEKLPSACQYLTKKGSLDAIKKTTDDI